MCNFVDGDEEALLRARSLLVLVCDISVAKGSYRASVARLYERTVMSLKSNDKPTPR